MSYDPTIARVGGRRFLLTCMSCMVYTALLAWGLIDGGQYVNLQALTVGAFIAGGTAQKFAERKDARNSPD